MATNDEIIKKLYPSGAPTSIQAAQNMYASALESQKAGMEQDFNKSNADLTEQQIAGQKQTDQNLNRTAVEAQKAQKNFAETQNAYGLTSGAMAQARLAQNNTALQNMTTLRAQQQENDAQIERQRGILKDQYAAAIREAQAKNDYELASKLYADAAAKEKAAYSAPGYVTPATPAVADDEDTITTSPLRSNEPGAGGRYVQAAKEAERLYQTDGKAAAAGYLRQVSNDANKMITPNQAQSILLQLFK